MSSNFNDEALARMLQEEENKQYEIYKADLELAEKIQNGSVIDLCSDNEETYKDTSSSNNEAATSTQHNEMSSFWNTLQLQKQQEENDFELAKTLENEVDDSILNEEIPDIYQLFTYFNKTYFNNILAMVEVRWSTKMTLCAGTCTYRKDAGSCTITLSEPLLKFRPKKDMFETLLHEMIHALLFVTDNNTDRDGHGPSFLKEAKRINDAGNYNISVYHTFNDEVDHYLTHIWQCNGICQDRPPYFGIVKRSVNRKPQKADTWFAEHERTCGGTYTKISEPPAKEKKRKKKEKDNGTLDNYFKDVDKKMKKLKEV